MTQIKENQQIEIEKLKKFIKDDAGFDLDNYKDEFVKRRFLPRALSLGFMNLTDYLCFLQKNDKEREIARKKIFVPTTEFFRNREVFEALKKLIVSDYKNANYFNVVSAPCSTGEEAFTLAMVFDEVQKECAVFGADGNFSVLKSLKKRKFTQKNLSPLYKNEIKRYFNEEGNLFSLKEDILSRVFPVQADLTKNFPFRGADIVFMRNFFIYLKEKTFLKCIENVERSIKKGGLLVLGKVERVELDKSVWETIDLNLKIFRFVGGKK
jgi:two-component system CheB/CheR fusion protein